MSSQRLWIGFCILILLLTACSTQYPETCPSNTPVGLANANEIANDDSLPFRFPLDASPIDDNLYYGWFGVSNECTPDIVACYEYPERKFHAAEDYKRSAGTPVYAMADGIISYSGRAGGYGWLILIDHPQANLYSLYGHLSPSRWKLKAGTEVARGELIAYLGDSDENGGSNKQPLDTHLHFGIRAGQTTDYPAKGEWRYMGGWIRLCPQDVGWLQPSLVITRQEIPVGGFPEPASGLFEKWGVELVLMSSYLIGGICALVFAIAKNTPRFSAIYGSLMIVAGLFLSNKGMRISYVLYPIAALLLGFAIFQYIRQSRKSPVSQAY